MRAQPRRGVMLCIAVAAVMIVAAAPAAQSPQARIDAAARAAIAFLEPWLGPLPPSSHAFSVESAWPDAPLTMDVEEQVAFQIARRYWRRQPPTPLMDGAARYLQSRVVARSFDLAAGRAGNGVESMRLFGGTYVRPIANLRFDGPTAGLDRGDSSPVARAALAFASLERITGLPRLIGALRTVIASGPASDDDLLRVLQEALGQDARWLFDSVLDPAKSMNYRIADVDLEPCSPAPCHRICIEVAHDGDAAFRDLEVRVDFADGQSPSMHLNGLDPSRAVVFEGPSVPRRVRIDPELVNLLDSNLLDQSKELEGRTNAPIGKWIARWTVWLQDAMLAYTAFV